MRCITLGILLLCLTDELGAAEPPLVEKYLHSGELARGEQVLEVALAAAPRDDEIRLSLGVLKIFRGVERLGQGLYEHGCKTEHNNVPFLRLPLPKNPDPTPISYAVFRRILDGFRSDLAAAEATLAGMSDEDVKLPLRFADIRLDLDGNQQAETTLSDVLQKLMGPNFRLPEGNPEFLVCIDRGDVAWLRAYCHLLMGLIEAQMALDYEQVFDLSTSDYFTNPKVRHQGQYPEQWKNVQEATKVVVIKEPARLGRFRKHLLAVCELNHETWRYIRSEQDNDHEWLPNPKQKGAIGLPVRDEMIDAWLGMIDEFKGLLNGKTVLPPIIVQFLTSESGERNGLSVKELLDNPPDKFDWEKIRRDGVDAKYLVQNGKDVDFLKLIRVGQVFQNSLSVGYAAWFN